MPEWDDTTGVGEALAASHSSRFQRDRACLVVLSGLHVGQMLHVMPGLRQVVGRGQSADIRLTDVGVSRTHVVIGPDADGDLVIEDLGSRNGTFVNGRPIGKHTLQDGDKIQLGRSTMVRFTYLDEFDESFQRLMYNSALRDGLTRVFNRRYFTERLDAEFHFAIRHGTRLSLLLLDLDHFKRVNDEHGHVAGDYVLTRFAEAIQRNVRNEDVFARFGGEEFALISRSIGAEDAFRFAERLRVVIEELTIEYEGEPIALSMSVGIGALPGVAAKTPLDLVTAADRALYQAKKRGRNQSRVYDPSDPSDDDERNDRVRLEPSDETQPY